MTAPPAMIATCANGVVQASATTAAASATARRGQSGVEGARHAPDGLGDDRDRGQLQPVDPARAREVGVAPSAARERSAPTADGSVKPSQAASPPSIPARRVPIAMPSWLLAGPGRSWQSATRSPKAGLVQPARDASRTRAGNSRDARPVRRTTSVRAADATPKTSRTGPMPRPAGIRPSGCASTGEATRSVMASGRHVRPVAKASPSNAAMATAQRTRPRDGGTRQPRRHRLVGRRDRGAVARRRRPAGRSRRAGRHRPAPRPPPREPPARDPRAARQAADPGRRWRRPSSTVAGSSSSHPIAWSRSTRAGLRLRPARRGAVAPSIDLLFSSAAKVYGDRLIAVVLTGTGSDGVGRRVERQDGPAAPSSSRTRRPPCSRRCRARCSPSIVDARADLGAIGGVVDGPRSRRPIGLPDSGDGDAALRRLLERIRDRSGIDFGAYKPATIVRRLQGRMRATGHTDDRRVRRARRARPGRVRPPGRQHADQGHRLPAATGGCGTTCATRSSPGCSTPHAASSRELRVWSAGCSSGEEAYSLAMTIAEAQRGAASTGRGPDLRHRRRSSRHRLRPPRRLPAGPLQDVPTELRNRYFTPRRAPVSRSVKALRAEVIFGEHDLSARVPFPRIDLLLCRNVLIYFTPALQRVALETFAFSLRTDGRLVLGQSESVAAAARAVC